MSEIQQIKDGRNCTSLEYYNEADIEERRNWMHAAIASAVGASGGITCWHCERTIVGSRFADREWDGHKYTVPVFDCACGESFGNFITEQVEAAALMPLFHKKLEELNQRAARIENNIVAQNKELQIARELLWLAWSNGAGYGDDGEMQWDIIDFKRMSMQEIRDVIQRRNLEQMRKESIDRAVNRQMAMLDITAAADKAEKANRAYCDQVELRRTDRGEFHNLVEANSALYEKVRQFRKL